MKFRIITSTVICLLAFHSIDAQKIKYKDLFPILDAKNYEEGGPQLVAYLANMKKEEANPNLQMGLMLEDGFLKYDIISDSSRIYTSGDSSVFFLEKAKSLIDEKELKKNDEYYQAFFRRDLRTGEFGIKVSDVHLDIEKKVEAIKQRISDVKALNQTLNSVEKKYAAVSSDYQVLSESYADINTLFLSISDEDLSKLTEMQGLAAEIVEEANSIMDIAERLKSDKYREEVALNPIQVFGKDGIEISDVKTGTISLWDYETWCRETLSEIRGGVGLFKTLISNYTKELRAKKLKLRKSQPVSGLAVPSDVLETFQKYDPTSDALTLLKMETFEARVMSNVDLQLNKDLLDSSKIGSQLKIYTEAKGNADTLYNLVNSTSIEGLADAKKKFPDYIDSFFSSHVTASKYVEDMKSWSARNKEWITNSVEYWTERNKWGIIAKEGEPERTIPLYLTDSLHEGFKVLRVNKFTIPQVVVYGVDSLSQKGYLGSFGEDRVEQWALEFDVPASEGMVYETDTIPSTEGATSFYLYNPEATENNLSAVCYTDSGTQEWAVTVTVSKKPVDFKFDDLTQELTILLYPEEDLPLDSDDLGYIVIDRTGNVR